MNPKLCKRLALTGPPGSASLQVAANESELHSSVLDQAALLLSIAEIAKSEIRSDGMRALWDEDEELPLFPRLTYRQELIPQSRSKEDAERENELCYPANRVRSVSIDSPTYKSTFGLLNRTHSPMELPKSIFATPGQENPEPMLVSPLPYRQRLPYRKHSLRLSSKFKRDYAEEKEVRKVSFEMTSSTPPSTPKKNKMLQRAPPRNTPMKKIFRKKFSWKNYPELEQFLIANREEYLRHSALNYTVQQKQYNNRLTERLLELATEHGYMFDEKEFSFVTVRDRIRCFFKSYVQSNKKKGVLLGYSARKAGLLTEEELEQSADTMLIITP